MSSISKHAISICLIGMGGLAWSLAGRPLVLDRELDAPLNPMGINGSPYGEVFAMAMQGPIDTYFHGAEGGEHHHAEGEECETCELEHDHDHDHADETASHEDHEDEGHDHHDHDHDTKPVITSGKSWADRLQGMLSSFDKASSERTNPKAATAAHKFYLRRQVEDKLRFAYRLDPSHYTNYNALHFFLTQPELGTRPELTPSAARLADETIRYCLDQKNDPRPMLTAAGACTNILQLMFADRKSAKPIYTVPQMRQYLALLDHCLGRYVSIAQEWDKTKNWELLSPQRIQECDERFKFVTKIRDAAEATIIRYESEASLHALNSQSMIAGH